ncbi:MAG: low molecular weight protein-tyrosine-phosphatase [Lachnospiraceae bacterium]|nr:low molecular weight protein-tyrosine-phosphatase [Lachnospiraceae bacterium]
MIKILFVCHGNICRSTMSEYVLKDMVKKQGLEDSFYIDSAATSREEIGNPVHWGTKQKLKEAGIFCGNHRARQMTKEDYDKFDFLIGMDSANIRNMNRILGADSEGKVYKLLDFCERKGDIADPWYTGNFDATYEDVREGCEALLAYIQKVKGGRCL